MVMFCKLYCGKDVNNLVISDMSCYTFCHSWQKQMKWTNIILILPTVERLCCLSLESKHKFFDRRQSSSSINANEVNPWSHYYHAIQSALKYYISCTYETRRGILCSILSAQSSLSIFAQKYLCKCEDTYFILQNKYLCI